MKLEQASCLKALVGHHISEKSSLKVDAERCYVFKVSPSSSKASIKESVEAIFSVKVTRVNVLNQKGKKKAFKGKAYSGKDFKKAYVFLRDGFSIDLA